MSNADSLKKNQIPKPSILNFLKNNEQWNSPNIITKNFLKSNTESDLQNYFERFTRNQSIYHLWSLNRLLKVSKWNVSLKKRLPRIVKRREKYHVSRIKRVVDYRKKRGWKYKRILKFVRLYSQKKFQMKNFLITKNKVFQRTNWKRSKSDRKDKSTTTFPTESITLFSRNHPHWLKTNIMARTRLIKSLNLLYCKLPKRNQAYAKKSQLKILNDKRKWKSTRRWKMRRRQKRRFLYEIDQIERNITNFRQFRWKKNKPLCYASLVYGTNSGRCVRWQQFNKSARTRFFYHNLFRGGRSGGTRKLNFFQLELNFIQSVYLTYSGYTRSR